MQLLLALVVAAQPLALSPQHTPPGWTLEHFSQGIDTTIRPGEVWTPELAWTETGCHWSLPCGVGELGVPVSVWHEPGDWADPVSGLSFLLVSLAPRPADLGDLELYVDLGTLAGVSVAHGFTVAQHDLAIPDEPALAGAALYLQAFLEPGDGNGWRESTGAKLVLGP